MQYYKLDLKDKKILSELMENTRFSYSTIAKNVELSREMVKYKIDRMIEEGVIEKFTTALFRPLVGMKMHFSFFITLQVSKSKKEKILKKLVSHPEILTVSELEGWFNLYVTFCVPNRYKAFELFEFLKEECELKDNFEFTMAIKNVYAEKNFFIDNEKIKSSRKNYEDAFQNLIEKSRKRSDKLRKLDSTDFKLLNLLEKDSRTPIKVLAKKLKVASNTVRSRMMKLIKEGVIFGFVPFLNYSKLGFKEYILLLRLKGTDREKALLKNKIRKDQRTFLEVWQVGKWDSMFILYSKDHEGVKDFISELLEEFPEALDKYNLLWTTKIHKLISYPKTLKNLYKEAKNPEERALI